MKILREEIYDENGLVRIIEHEVEDTIEQEIADKEAQLLQMYQELQELKNRQS
jgi:hypothetical protein